jgi:sensor c-di-GMP phosphodiesterase-like protein
MDAISLDSIRAGLEKREFFLVYLPTVSLHDGRCVGAEALIRWRRPGNVVVDPEHFIPLTDQTPLSGAITYWVIDTVAGEIGDWLGANEDAHISINVPPEILGRGGLDYAAMKSGLRAHVKQVILEITERGVPDQLGLDALNSIAETGARVALDDTSLSGANLALLTRCKFDIVKIDGTLVNQLATGEPRPAWLDGLGGLLKSTPLQIIAEGVETGMQADSLKAAGVQMAQGHFFSRPLSADELFRYYTASRAGK